MPPIDQIAEFASNHVLLASGFVGSILLVIFSELQRKNRALTDVPPQDVVRLMNNDASVIDVRTVENFQTGHLVNARNIPGTELSPDHEKLKSLKNETIVIVCDSGMAGPRIAATLRKGGFENAFSLKGGIAAWRQDSLPLVTKQKSGKKKGNA